MTSFTISAVLFLFLLFAFLVTLSWQQEMQAIISGAGVAGLLLALSLKKLGLDTSVYEQAPEFGEGVGGEPFAITS